MLSRSEPQAEIEIATNKITTMFLYFSWVCMNLLISESPLIKVTTLTTSRLFLPCFSAFSRFLSKKSKNIHLDLQFFLQAIRYLFDLLKKIGPRVATDPEVIEYKRKD